MNVVNFKTIDIDGNITAQDLYNQGTEIIKSEHLPSFVDDAIEGYLHDSVFYSTRTGSGTEQDPYVYTNPITGESGKIYIELATNSTYRWSGSVYVQIGGGGSGAVSYLESQSLTDGQKTTAKTNIGLESVVNTGDSNTPVSGGTTKFTTGGAYTELAKKVNKVSVDYVTDNNDTLALITGMTAGQKALVKTTGKIHTYADSSWGSGTDGVLGVIYLYHDNDSDEAYMWDGAFRLLTTDNAKTLEGHPASHFATASALNTHANDSTVHMSAAEKTKLSNMIEGIQKNGTDLTPDANHKVNMTVPTTANDITYSATSPTAGSAGAELARLGAKADEIGMLTDLTTTAKNTLVAAVNEIDANKITNPSGGSVGQVLTKTASGEAWQDASGGGGGDVHKEAIADEFSTASTYAVNTIVMYNGLRYKCHTAIVTAGAWTGSTNWETESVQDTIDDISAAVELNKEVVTITLKDYQNNPLVSKTVTVHIVNVRQQTLITDANGQCTVMINYTLPYFIIYPDVVGFTTPSNTQVRVAQSPYHTFLATYNLSRFLSLNIESNSSPNWGELDNDLTYGWSHAGEPGNVNDKTVIDDILYTGNSIFEYSDPSVCGTFVIDPNPHTGIDGKQYKGYYARLDPNDHSKFAPEIDSNGNIIQAEWFPMQPKGTATTANAPMWGECFRRLPRVYYKVVNLVPSGGTGSRIYISLSPLPDTNGDIHYWEEDWIGTYKGAVLSENSQTVLHSRPYLTPYRTSTENLTMTQFWNAAQLLHTDFGLVDYFDHCKLNALHLLKFGNANSESTMGMGLAATLSSSYYNTMTGMSLDSNFRGLNGDIGPTVGNINYRGTGEVNFSGSLNQNKLFGIEALSGQTWEFRPNIRFYMNGNTRIGLIYEGNIVSNTITEGRTISPILANLTSGGIIKSMYLGDNCDFIPIESDGSSSENYCDKTWAATSGQLLLVGGHSTGGSLGGLSAADSRDGFSRSDTHIGARLAFKGNISDYDFVSGADLVALHQN